MKKLALAVLTYYWMTNFRIYTQTRVKVKMKDLGAIAEKVVSDLGKRLQFCFVALATVSLTAAFAQNANLLANCEKLYQLNKFPEAKASLEQLLTIEPKNATAHYLLGNVYVRLQQKTPALLEYSSAIQCDRSGAVAAYARTGINALTQEDENATAKSAPVAGPASQPNLDRQELTRSVQSVSHEVDNRNLVRSAEYDARMKQILQDGEIESTRLQSELDDRRSQFTVEKYTPSPTGPRPVYDHFAQDQLRQLEAEYRTKKQILTVNQRKRIDEAQKDLNARQGASEASAVGIESSYLGGQTNSNVKLMPMGTTLYNRNYQTFGDPSGNAIPVSAPPAKTLNKH